MKKTLFKGILFGILGGILFMFSILLVGCEEIEPPPDDTEYFTDITYEVTQTGPELTPDITYGSWIYSNPNDPNTLVWEEKRAEDVTLPWSVTVSTCKGHPVSMGAIVTGKDRTMTFNIYDKDVLVATVTYESNGFLWGGDLEYDIPKP